eukprot:TRINITY_DN9761_c0_g1_i4.p1 TRINITY_DN9761_c0_g1~~TRINITY_DN9761_c0_g1_i4.p1  ORF type:complete len:216 (-),score=25.70 TRINITY_DN9761_c0_g1_i4:240-887(-)
MKMSLSSVSSLRVCKTVVSGRRHTVRICATQQQDKVANSVERRQILFTSLLAVGLSTQLKASALIPDDDDEIMIEKAKARRSARLQEQKEVQREFLTSEGIKDQSVQEQVDKIQRTVLKLAQSGKALEDGDLSKVGDVLSASEWLDEFKVASSKLSLTASQKDKADGVVQELASFMSSASSGSDLVAAKKSYVAAIDAFESWCSDTGLRGSLKGL